MGVLGFHLELESGLAAVARLNSGSTPGRRMNGLGVLHTYAWDLDFVAAAPHPCYLLVDTSGIRSSRPRFQTAFTQRNVAT